MSTGAKCFASRVPMPILYFASIATKSSCVSVLFALYSIVFHRFLCQGCHFIGVQMCALFSVPFRVFLIQPTPTPTNKHNQQTPQTKHVSTSNQNNRNSNRNTAINNILYMVFIRVKTQIQYVRRFTTTTTKNVYIFT